MSLFNNPRSGSQQASDEPSGDVPVLAVDVSKRYDIYCLISGEDRLYEDVRVVAIRTFEPKSPIKGLVSGYLEVEARDGARMLIPHIRMYMICEHGVQPRYKVLRQRKTNEEG
jgi:hypothetical protein